MSHVLPHGMPEDAIERYQSRYGKGPLLTADMVLFTLRPTKRRSRLSVLTIERAKPPWLGCAAFPGGHVDGQENLLSAARRELAEETTIADLKNHPVWQVGAYGDAGRDPRAHIVGIAFATLVPFELVEHAKGSDDAKNARFYDVSVSQEGLAILSNERGEGVPLAFDHSRMLTDALAQLHERARYSSLIIAQMQAPFTMSTLRDAYESVFLAPWSLSELRMLCLDQQWIVPIRSTVGSVLSKNTLFRPAHETIKRLELLAEQTDSTAPRKSKRMVLRTSGYR